ncbi:nuclear transport factor 2 family protein [Bacillus paralicheniformis]|uniref:nuclear transport factor 2 family protein n=1 Tax=Bacillus paralicheniformis TaxID=1648923 RepID=UPI004045C7D2
MAHTITDVREQFLQSMLEKDMEKWIQLWDQDAVFEHPYAPPGFPKKLEGKSAIYEYIKDFPEKIDIVRFTAPTIHQMANTGYAAVEFECEGTVCETGLPYNQQYISLVNMKEGKVVHYKDYWNPLTVIESFGGTAADFLMT